jgi:hypothetical protein
VAFVYNCDYEAKMEVSPLVKIKLLHTVVWFFFASCILALPVAGMFHRFRLAAALTVIVLVECVVLVANHFRCPLTNLATLYTADRAPNFDIYLPAWLARNNQIVFGTLFVAAVLFVLWEWIFSG